MKVKTGNAKIAPLTSARFFAAMYVVLFHTAYNSGFQMPSWLKIFLSMGTYSVSFFFALSGYILATVYLRDGSKLDLRRFWKARFARVYPLFFLMLVLDTPYIVLDRAARLGWHPAVVKTGINFGLDLFLLQGWSPSFNVINFPSWSLSDEAFFYAIFPFVALFLWKMRPRNAAGFGVLLYLGTMATGIVLRKVGCSVDYSWNLPLLRAAEFVLGIVAGKLHLAALRHDGYRKLLRNTALVVLVTCILLFCLIPYARLPIEHAMLIGIFMVPISIGLILALASEPPGVSLVLSKKLPVLLGEASFALYLLHIPLWQLYQAFHLGGSRSHYLGFLVVATGLSMCSFCWFETPARRMILAYGAIRDVEGTVRSSIA